MREVTTPPAVEVDPGWNITDLLLRTATERPQRVVYTRLVAGVWQDVTATQFRDEAVAIAKGLIASGVEPGERVAIMSRTRYEWTLVDAAIWFAGAVSVPVYETSSQQQVAWIMTDSQAKAAFAETRENADSIRRALNGVQQPVWVFDDGALGDLICAGADIDDAEVERRRRLANLGDLATIVYTSGTTGNPKGCELSHGNFVVLSENASEILSDVVGREDSATLLFLPLAHVFARFIEVLCMSCGARLSHTSDPKRVIEDLAAVQPTFILSVPRIFEKIYNAAEQKAEAAGRGTLFRSAAATAVAYSRSLETGRFPLRKRVKYAAFNRLVYPKVRAVFGGRAEFAVSGGSPLGERLGHFFRGVGLTVLEGYGLTETTAPTTVNLPARTRMGSVGLALPGTGIKISSDGEILVKGPHVFARYWNNPSATEEAFVDGWFHTGDIGSLDEDGFLRITGRSKEILVTAGGKNVAPAVLEDRLRAHPLISQCMVVGDNKPYVAAILTLDEEMLPTWAANEGRRDLTIETAVTDDHVLATLQSAVDAVNATVSKAESIRRFIVLDHDFTVESGHLTPSLKLKRAAVLTDHAVDVDGLYEQARR